MSCLNAPRWTDMPKFESFEGLAEMTMPNATMIQIADVVYQGEKGISITSGNLFGSQTVLVKDYREALMALSVLSDVARTMEKCQTDAQIEKNRINTKKHGWKLLPNQGEENGKKEEVCANPLCECGGTCYSNR